MGNGDELGANGPNLNSGAEIVPAIGGRLKLKGFAGASTSCLVEVFDSAGSFNTEEKGVGV